MPCSAGSRSDAVAAAARGATGLFCLNAAPARPVPEPILERADLIIVNEIEHETLHDQLTRFEGLLVVTRGARGAEAFRRGNLIATAQPPPIDAVDTVGAGDAFCGSLVVDMARGTDIAVALQQACRAGAVAATRVGAQPSLPTHEDLESG